MKPTRKPIGWRRERGAIAVELAFVLPILVLFLALPSIYLAFYIRQYSAAQKAVHDAALYLSTAPGVEVTTAGPDGSFAAVGLAKTIVAKELAGVVPDGVPIDVTVACTYLVAGDEMNRSCTPMYSKDIYHTLLRMDVSIGFYYANPLTNSQTGNLISAYTPVRYVGN